MTMVKNTPQVSPLIATCIKTKNILQEKAMEATKQKEEKRKKPKHEEQEGMPHRQHCPPERRHGDRNP
jgi:hypothetical protein